MSIYSSGALVSLILFGMAVSALVLGVSVYRGNINSAAGRKMFIVFASVFIWDAGYAWMGLCHGDDFAYVPRAIALAGVFIYMLAVLEYVGSLSGYYPSRRYCFYAVYTVTALVSWTKLIDTSSVTFSETPWGYWYKSTMTWGRYLQFGCILVSILFYYLILHYWTKITSLKRERALIRRFMIFGPIMFAGYIFDTLLPSLYDVSAVPGSAVAAFISSILLISVSSRYDAFGAAERNVGEYVFREVKIPVLVMDMNGKIVLWNEIAPLYFGRIGTGLAGLTRDDLMSLPYDEEMLEETSGEEIYSVIDMHTYCKLTTTVIYDNFDEVLYTICFVQDMTDTQNALKMMNEGKNMAEAANASKSAFLANMSHEIRTPMNAIIGMSDILLQNSEVQGEQKQQIRNIREAGESLLGIINDVLDISKIEAGRSELVEEKYSFPEMIHAVNSIIRVKTTEADLEYIVDIDPELPREIIGDEMRVRQILLNIVSNAVKFTERGYVHLKVHGEIEYGGIRLYMDVADTGIGMHEVDLKRIFDSFSQVDTHKNRSRQGTGLGLSISLRLAQAMSGDITVESVYGHGTTFHINIFQRMDGYEAIGEEVARSIKDDSYEYRDINEEFEYVERPDKLVLVVDDSKVNLMVAKGLLAPYKMDVDLADNGKFAVEMARNNDYDCIFMDHMMPEMDGVETTHAIRALGGYNATVPIVALTANAVDGTKEHLIAEGMQDFIAKPINKKCLNDIVEKYC